ncbi:MAG: YraN family protein [Gammaproteobacteria bacterium]|nr:YraN family protein [Gammaproteobacteria bacterium]
MRLAARRGQTAERAARSWLEQRGLQLLAQNFSCRYGELDLVMADGDTLVVVEVRSRQSPRFMTPECSIDSAKQQRIINAAEVFLQQHPRFADNAVRFDVVALVGNEVRWIRDAFMVESDGSN